MLAGRYEAELFGACSDGASGPGGWDGSYKRNRYLWHKYIVVDWNGYEPTLKSFGFGLGFAVSAGRYEAEAK